MSAPDSAQVLPQFTDPSRQIRLLQRRCDGNSSLHFDLAVWHLDSLPEYQAISYTWGSPLNTADIWLNGKQFEVRENCHHALWQAGLHFPKDYIWTDSVCIDQSNVDEKNKQVQMMSEIYARAKGVLACIGPHADNSERLCQQGLADEPSEYVARSRIWQWKLLRPFWHRPYWTRLWIVQELSLAKQVTILCGHDIIKFDSLSLMPWRSDWTDFIPGAPGFVLNVIRGHKYADPLWRTVLGTAHQQCQEPWDHVYATLALTGNEPIPDQDPVKVDYSISLSSLMLEVLMRHGDGMGIRFGTDFQTILSLLGLTRSAGLTTLLELRNSLMSHTVPPTGFDEVVIAARKDSSLMKNEHVPGLLKYLCHGGWDVEHGCKVAGFGVDSNGQLQVRRARRSDFHGPHPTRLTVDEKKYLPGPTGTIMNVSFTIAIDEDCYTASARIAATAMPGDLLMRTGQHIFGSPDVPTGIRPPQSLTVAAQVYSQFHPDELGARSPEQLVVLRWMVAGLWKVVAQGHFTSCIPMAKDDTASKETACFDQESKRFMGDIWSIMSPEASMLMWTHCNALHQQTDAERLRTLDRISSRPPPSSYFYMPWHNL